MKKSVIFILAVFVLIAGACSQTPPPAADTPSPSDTPQPTATRTPRPSVTPQPTPTETQPPVVMPAGALIALVGSQEGALELFTLDFNQNTVIQITEHHQVVYSPLWSPDGSHLAYVLYDRDAERVSLWTLNYEARTMPKEIPAEFSDPSLLSWSFDNQYLVYTDGQPDGFEMDVYRVNIDTGKIDNLTAPNAYWDFAPICSPNSAKIAFVSDRPTDQENFDDIWVMDLDGSNPVNLTDNGMDYEDWYPAWSADGRQIAFIREATILNSAGGSGLYVIDADGANERLLIEFEAFTARQRPAWSPDGKYIAYVPNVGEATINIVRSDGSEEPIAIKSIPGEKTSLSWSSDSSVLIFTNHQGDFYTIYSYNLSTAVVAPLAENTFCFDGVWRP